MIYRFSEESDVLAVLYRDMNGLLNRLDDIHSTNGNAINIFLHRVVKLSDGEELVIVPYEYFLHNLHPFNGTPLVFPFKGPGGYLE